MQMGKKDFVRSIFLTTFCGLIFLSFIVCSSSMAKGRSNNFESITVDKFMSLLSKQLNLKKEQEIHIRPEIENDFKERQKIMADLGGSRENKAALKAELQSLQKTTEAFVSPFLTDEQLKNFKILYEQKLPKTPKESGKTPGVKRGRS